MNIIVHGCTGRMGTMLLSLIADSAHTLAAGISPSAAGEGRYAALADYTGPADCVIDFSNHSATAELTACCARRGLPLVIATTAQTEEDMVHIRAAAEVIPVFYSANMSVGIALLADLARQTAAMFPDADIEIVEKHHNQKLDVPSGTALMLANAIREVRPQSEFLVGRRDNGKRTKQEIGIHSLRYGSEVGTHEIIISTGRETLTLKHEAENRALFADGALAAAEFIIGRTPGVYDMRDMLE